VIPFLKRLKRSPPYCLEGSGYKTKGRTSKRLGECSPLPSRLRQSQVTLTPTDINRRSKPIQEIEGAVVRFAGDSGDGMQLTGNQFTTASAIFGNDVSTFPDYPAEIRAPTSSLTGVSGFQINFSSRSIHTPGDHVDTLIAMNPVALRTNLGDLVRGGLIITNSDNFNDINLAKAGYAENPLEDGSLDKNYRVVKIPLSRLNRETLADTGLGVRVIDRCKNFFALGLTYWLYDRPLDPTLHWIHNKLGRSPAIAKANIRSLHAGYHFGETTELFTTSYRVVKATIPPGKYRTITGNDGLAMGLITAAQKANRKLFYGSYPITPASDILHALARYKNFGVYTFQAEDEIAAVTAAIGASFAGALAATGTSGPGLTLKNEGIGLAVMTELPLVIIDVQRGGPSTGLPTKTEQADLLQSLFGRSGECPIPVIAPCSPADCFNTAIEAFRISIRFMVPVLVLSDGYLANAAEPWCIPDAKDIPAIDIPVPEASPDQPFLPYARNNDLARPWALPGTPGFEHRVGGLEKENLTGVVSYDADNHHAMVQLRARKVANVTRMIEPVAVTGPSSGELLVVGWGGTFGAITVACDRLRASGRQVSNLHLRHLNPLPPNLGDVLERFKRILVPEVNLGQLVLLLRAKFLVDAVGFNRVRGKPFLSTEVEEEIVRLLQEKK